MAPFGVFNELCTRGFMCLWIGHLRIVHCTNIQFGDGATFFFLLQSNNNFLLCLVICESGYKKSKVSCFPKQSQKFDKYHHACYLRKAKQANAEVKPSLIGSDHLLMPPSPRLSDPDYFHHHLSGTIQSFLYAGGGQDSLVFTNIGNSN